MQGFGSFQRKLGVKMPRDELARRHGLELAPDTPRAPHLDGKVGRVRRTALEEFWPTTDPRGPDAAVRLEDGRTFYDHHRPRGALGGGAPAGRIAELAGKIPTHEAIQAAHDPSREFIRTQGTTCRWRPTKARVT